jgi:hypothetical protein
MSAADDLLGLLQQATLCPTDPVALDALGRALRRLGYGGLPLPTARSADVFIRTLDDRIISLSGNVLCIAYSSTIALESPANMDASARINLCVARDRAHAQEIIGWIADSIQAGAPMIDLREAPTRHTDILSWPHP